MPPALAGSAVPPTTYGVSAGGADHIQAVMRRLLVSGRGIAPQRISAFLSHKDLPHIILHFLADRPLPEVHDSLLTVGSTERWGYGQITQQGDYLFIDNNTGAVLAGRGIDDPQAIFELFQHDLNVFAARYQRQ